MAKKKPKATVAPNTDDAAMAKVRIIWAKRQTEGWTQERLGIAMGAAATSARQAAHQLLKGHDPRISTLRKFAKAVGVPLTDIVHE